MINSQKSSIHNLTDLMFAKAGITSIPLSGTFELSPVCNFNCKMCYVRKSQKEVEQNERGLRTLEEWTSIAEKACKQGMLYILLTGGEPTLWPDFWVLYERLVKMGLLVSVNTNGSLLDDAAIERLIKYPPRRINITLYGASDATYKKLCGIGNVFSKVEHAIKRLKEAGIQMKLNCSLTPYNVQDLEQMVAFAQDNKLILDVATYMFPPVRRDASKTGVNDRFTPSEAAEYRLKTYFLQHGEEQYQRFLQSIREGAITPPGLDENCYDPVDGEIRCRAGKSCFWITWDGYLTPCGMMTKPKVDLKNIGFEKAWETLNDRAKQIKLSGICRDCPDQNICHSCAAMALSESGNFTEVPRYLCETVREMKKIAKNEILRD